MSMHLLLHRSTRMTSLVRSEGETDTFLIKDDHNNSNNNNSLSIPSSSRRRRRRRTTTTTGAITETSMDQANGEENVGFLAALPADRKYSSVAGLLHHGQAMEVIKSSPTVEFQPTWQQRVSMLCVKILWHSNGLLAWVGLQIEWLLNFVTLNGGLRSSLKMYLNVSEWGSEVYPELETDNYYSIIGQIDPRQALLHEDSSPSAKSQTTKADVLQLPKETHGSRHTADLCVMAAKLSYENEAVVKKVVETVWNMHFVGFYNCWNERQKVKNTQVFVFMDKPSDATSVVIAWRGTEGFNALDWSTDLDFSWVDFKNEIGRVHLGFLEALGLGNRNDMRTFTRMRTNAQLKRDTTSNSSRAEHGSPTKEGIDSAPATSGLSDEVIADPEKRLAYDDITNIVAKLLHDNPKAKVYITGHSLGGALAALYSTMLFHNGEVDITEKLASVYTFGQPRVGDETFSKFGTLHLGDRYFRVVYCNDIVPRVPFDDKVMEFKHFGNCVYFNSVYRGLVLKEAPNKNYFDITSLVLMHFNSYWELFHSVFILGQKDGYQCSLVSVFMQCVGLIFPGPVAHSPLNYVNAVRISTDFPLNPSVRSNLDDMEVIEENAKDVYDALHL